MIEIQAPHPYTKTKHMIFLAGSIEMGKAENWQTRVVEALKDYDVTILNPRRADWDNSWKQTIDDPQFNQQVTWELQALEDATEILMYFDPATKSPISLLELGLFAHTGKLIVCCPEGFWRKGNVDIVCKRYGIFQVPSLDKLFSGPTLPL
jgi:hypothetical protein